MKTIASLGAAPLCFSMAGPATAADAGARYPTSDEAFYVLACMEMNGRDADGLCRCSCAINAVGRQLSHDEYSDADSCSRCRRPVEKDPPYSGVPPR
jgi:hypothetical protein